MLVTELSNTGLMYPVGFTVDYKLIEQEVEESQLWEEENVT